MDANDNFYVADASNRQVMKFSRGGAQLRSWGDRGTESSPYVGLSGIAAGVDGSTYVTDTGKSVLFEAPQITVLERQRIAAGMGEQELSYPDIMDPAQAVRVGEMPAADYILVGSVIEMSNGVVVFSRLINVKTGAIESVSQVIVPRNEDVESLLRETG